MTTNGNEKDLTSRIARLESILESIEEENRQFKDKVKKDSKVRMVISGIIALMLIFFGTMMYKTYALFKSPEFLEGVGYKAQEVGTVMIDKMKDTLDEKGPQWVEMLKTQTADYLPKLVDDINNKYIPAIGEEVQKEAEARTTELLSGIQVQSVDFIANTLHPMIMAEFETVFDEFQKTGKLTADKFNEATIKELQELLVAKFDEHVAKAIKEDFAKNLETCIDTGDRVLDSLSEFKNLPDDKRQAMAFEVFRAFIDTIDYVQTGNTKQFQGGAYGTGVSK